jgi:hypothetical protein
MIKLLSSTLFILFFTCYGWSNEGYEIKVDIKDYAQSEIILGFHYNGKQLVKDTARINEKNTFVFKGTEALKPGVYMIILLPSNRYFELLIDEDDQHFSIQTTAQQPTENLSFTDSPNNKIFSKYLKFIHSKNKEASVLQAQIDTLGQEKVNQQLQKIGLSIREYQRKIIADYPQTLAASLIRGAMEVDIPELEGSEQQIQQYRYDYYKMHYFDNIDLADPRLIRSPLLLPKVEQYFEKLVHRLPDSINIEVDRIIKKASANSDTYKYWLGQLLNKYADLSGKYVGYDAVYVHIALTYYCNPDSRVDWIDEDTREKICRDAKKFKAVLIGNPAPRVRFKDQNDEWLDLYDVEADFTIVYFYKPNCSYCEASIPKANAFIEARKDQRIKMISVCNKRGDEVPKCWETTEKMEMNNWVNVTDPFAQGLSKFKVESFPTIFVLDKNKNIISKGIASDQLNEIINIYQQSNE